ncbi:MAG: rRNA pseudouridine synthase [Bacteroidales bacterium]|nr:rRNA pseudouridine synthase [Bacteroidales bacterium]
MREFAIFAAQNLPSSMERRFNTEDMGDDSAFDNGRGRKSDRPRRDNNRNKKYSPRSKEGFQSRPRRRFDDDDTSAYSGKRSFKGGRDQRGRYKKEDNRPRRRDITGESSILSEIVERRKQEGRLKPRKQKILTLEFEEQHGPIRLNKYIANAGICSRRDADVLIASGAITVNGEVVTEMGHKVMPTDEVRYGDKVLQREKPVYVLLNKPKDYITTTDDERDRANVMELVRDACQERIYPVGRLDRDTTGLLLLTNDGDLTKKLTHPSSHIEKTYMVELDKPFASVDMDTIRHGIELSDGVVTPDDVEYVEGADSKKIVGITIHSGKNRVIRRMFDALGYEVVKLDRVIFAGLTKKDLPRGRWRFLTKNEISFLKMISTKNKEEEK